MSKKKLYILKIIGKLKKNVCYQFMYFIVFGIIKFIFDLINFKIESIEEILKYKMR